VANHTDSEMFLVSFTRHPYDAKKKRLVHHRVKKGSSPLIPNFKAIRCLHGKLVAG